MVGRCGKVEQRLSPEGFVRVRGERWRAEAADGRGGLEPGRQIVVRRVEGLKLVVEPVAAQSDENG